MSKIKRNLLFILCAGAIAYLKIVSISDMTCFNQYIVSVTQYMNDEGLITIYENILFLLPFLLLVHFMMVTIGEYYDNRIYIISRLKTKRNYFNFMIKLILRKVIYYVIIFYLIVIIIGTLFFSIKNVNIKMFFILFFNAVVIAIIFSLLFYLLLPLFGIRYAYLSNIVIMMVYPIRGFVARYLENYTVAQHNFMTCNIIYDLKVSLGVSFNFKALWVAIMLYGILWVYNKGTRRIDKC